MRNVESAYLVFFLYFYCFLLFDFFCTFNGHESCCIGMNIGHQRIWMTSSFWVFKKINPFCMSHVNIKELSIRVHCTWLAESMNKRVKRMLWGESWVHCQDLFVKLLIQLVREILHLPGKRQVISETSGFGNHAYPLYTSTSEISTLCIL